MTMLIRASALSMTTVAIMLLPQAFGQRAAQRPKADAEVPAAVGKVVGYTADKSISVEVKQRGGEAKKVDFVIVKDKTRIELGGAAKAIEVGMTVAVFADKDNPKAAARISAGGRGDAGAAPTAAGKVVAFQAEKSITVEVRKRGGETEKREFAIVKDKTKVELVGTTKAIEVGTEVRIFADADNPKAAARIVAGQAGVRPRPNP